MGTFGHSGLLIPARIARERLLVFTETTSPCVNGTKQDIWWKDWNLKHGAAGLAFPVQEQHSRAIRCLSVMVTTPCTNTQLFSRRWLSCTNPEWSSQGKGFRWGERVCRFFHPSWCLHASTLHGWTGAQYPLDYSTEVQGDFSFDLNDIMKWVAVLCICAHHRDEKVNLLSFVWLKIRNRDTL